MKKKINFYFMLLVCFLAISNIANATKTGSRTSKAVESINFTYLMEVTDAQSCSPAITISKTSICKGESVTVTYGGMGVSGNNYYFNWAVNPAGACVPPNAGPITGGPHIYTCSPLVSTTYTVTVTMVGCSSTKTGSVSVRVDSLSSAANAGPDQTSCSTTATFQGNAPAIGSGYWSLISGSGTISNSYDSASSVTNLGMGANTFRWTIIRGACISVDEVIITRTSSGSPPASFVPDGPTTFCRGGAVILNANTGSGLSYQWIKDGGNVGTNSSNYTATSSGIYTLVVSDLASCAATSSPLSITVDEMPSVAIAGANQIVCRDFTSLNGNEPAEGLGTWSLLSGTAIITDPFTYNSFLTGIALGSNTLKWTISNGTCPSNFDEVMITRVPEPIATITPLGATTFCEGQSVVLKANTGLSYEWKKDDNFISGAIDSNYVVTSSGSYVVIVTNSAMCTASSAPLVVTVNSIPAKPVITKSGNTLVCSSSSGTFQWSLEGTAIPGAINSSYTFTENGSYTVTNTVNGCSSTSDVMTVTLTGIISSEKLNWLIYPNPAKNHIVVEGNFSSNNVLITITDLLGNSALEKTEKPADKYYLDTEGLSGGIYFIDVRSGKERLIKRITIIK